jgi:hypothetical protein
MAFAPALAQIVLGWNSSMAVVCMNVACTTFQLP